MITENEEEACPEKKLKSEGFRKILINELISRSLQGRNLATHSFVRLDNMPIHPASTKTKAICTMTSRLGYFRKKRKTISNKKGIQGGNLVTKVQKESYVSLPSPFK